MSIDDLSNRVVYDGDGTNTVFPFSFPVQFSTDLEVWLTDSLGNVTQLFTNFQVDMFNANVLYPTTGTPLAADGSTLTLLRVVPLTQDTIFTSQGPLPSIAIANALDKLTMAIQQLLEFIGSQCLQIPSNPSGSFSTALPTGVYTPGAAIVVNGSGNGFILSSVPTVATGARVYREGLTGTVDGTNKAFTSSQNFVSGAEEVFLGGILQNSTEDYAVTGANQITFVNAPQPGRGAILMHYTISS